MTLFLLITGVVAMIIAMVILIIWSEDRSVPRLVGLIGVAFAALAMVLLVSGGYRWGHNSAAEDAQRSAATTERK